MGKLIFLGLFLASLDPTYREASDVSRRALLETSMMKQELKTFQDEAERRLYQYTRLTKDELAYAAYAYPLFTGKVSTKPFKNFKYTTESHWTFRPELEYGIYSKETSAFVFVTTEF